MTFKEIIIKINKFILYEYCDYIIYFLIFLEEKIIKWEIDLSKLINDFEQILINYIENIF